MSDELLNWRVGSQMEFDALKAFGAPPGPELACRRSPTDSPWGRAQDFNMGRSLVDAGLAEQQRFRRMSNTDKLAVALRGAVNSLPSQFRDKAQELLDPANLAIMAGALAIWVGTHATPVGWIVDIGMVGMGVVALGVEAVAVAREIQAFAQGVIKAQNEGDLIAAGRHLGQAVAIGSMPFRVELDLSTHAA